MKVFVILFFNFVFFVSQFDKTESFCVAGHEGLHAKLTRAVVRSSDWLQQFYAKTSYIQPYIGASMIFSLRLSGHQPDNLLSKFKSNFSLSIKETLKNYLDNEVARRGNLSFIPTGQLAHIVQSVIAICEDPANFYGHNLFATLRSGAMTFKKKANFQNYFQYSLVAIAFCNGGLQIPETMVKELLRGVYRKVSYHINDIDALILIALSCVKKDCSISNEVNNAMTKLVSQFITQQNKSTGDFGNQYSTALGAQALIAARVHTDKWECVKAMKNLLNYQNDEGSFGTILANIQITPSLLGESFIHLNKLHCPIKTPAPPQKEITVYVNLDFDGNVNDSLKTEPPKVAVKILEGNTAYDMLVKAKEQDNCYTAKYKQYSFGKSVTAICDIAKNSIEKLYWMIYVNGKMGKYGVDGLKPKDGALVTFKYEKLSF